VKRINLLEIIYTLGFGGAERLAATICQNLDRELFDPKVCGLYGEDGPLTESLNQSKIPSFFLKGETMTKPIFLKAIYDSIKRENVTLIHVHGFYLLLQCLLPAKLAGVKIVYTEHANFTIKRFRKYSLLASIFPYFVDRMTTVSGHLKDYFVNELKVPSSKIQVIYNGVDLEKFKSFNGNLSRIQNGKIRIGTVGRLNQVKDHETLLKALAIIHGIRDDFHMTIVGDGELRSFLEKRIDDLKISDHVDLLGNREDIPQLLSDFDIFLLSSKREGFPITLLEAMACGKPVIATEVGGIPEAVHDGENGLLVPPENPETLAKAILGLLQDRQLMEDIARRGRQTVEGSFSMRGMMQSYQELFLDMMGRSI
jgi:glycosyltransferase involved in cell wall biosynthesis